MRRFFSSFAVTVQVSDQYVTTGLIIVLYIFILVFSLGILILLVLNWHNMLWCLLLFFQQLNVHVYVFIYVYICILIYILTSRYILIRDLDFNSKR